MQQLGIRTDVLDTTPFNPYGLSHLVPVLLSLVILILLVLLTEKRSFKCKKLTGLVLSAIPCLCVIFRMCYEINSGESVLEVALPLHACRIIPFIAFFGLLYEKVNWMVFTYFSSMTMNLMALLSPELFYDYPHITYIVFFLLHGILFIVPLYFILSLRIKPRYQDVIIAFIVSNIYGIIITIFNFSLGTNYSYTLEKPNTPSILDILGDWPYYIFGTEIIGIILFILFYLPFHNINKVES